MGNNLRNTFNTSTKTAPRFSFKKVATIFLLFAVLGWGINGLEENYKEIPAEIAYFTGDLISYHQTARDSSKLCLLYFSKPYCYPCQTLEENYLRNRELLDRINKKYLPYQINEAANSTLFQSMEERYQVHLFPMLIITDASGNELGRVSDINSADELVDGLGLKDESIELTHDLNWGKVDGEGSYGLLISSSESFEEAQHLAYEQRLKWVNDIWIEPGDQGRFNTILGTFYTEKDAVIAQRYLKMSNKLEAKLIKLTPQPLAYN